jgi:hypothetical protein
MKPVASGDCGLMKAVDNLRESTFQFCRHYGLSQNLKPTEDRDRLLKR